MDFLSELKTRLAKIRSETDWQAWGELLRLPNFWTVPGDPLVGYILAHGGKRFDWEVIWALLSCTFLYGFGMILNDLSDEDIDAEERPKRPLPSKRILRKDANRVAMALMVLGMLSAILAEGVAFFVAAWLVVAIVLYNLFSKHWMLWGALNMGLCRVLSVLVGAVSGTNADSAFGLNLLTAFSGALVIGGFIACVTWVAAGEMEEEEDAGWPKEAAWIVLGFVWLPVLLTKDLEPSSAQWGLLLGTGAVAVMAACWIGSRIRKGSPVPKRIGQWIGLLLLVQAAIIQPFVSVQVGVSLLVLAVGAWIARALTGRRFYSS